MGQKGSKGRVTKGDVDVVHGGGGTTDLFSVGGAKKYTLEDFDLLKVVGKGSFGKVFQVRAKETGKIYAMKVLRKEQVIARNQVDHTKAERNILEEISHPNIVRLRFAFQTDDKLYMVMDYMSGGELFFHLKKDGRFDEDRTRFYAGQILMALEHLHNLDMIYRDLKPENILLDDAGNSYITDFGLSKEAVNTQNSARTFCGTPEYLAPEILENKGHGKAVDWWSLGTLIFEMLTGLPPFYSQNLNVMYEKILKAEIRFPDYISAEAQSLLRGLLTRDVNRRLGSNGDGAEIRRHPWFAKLDFDKLLKKQLPTPFKPEVKLGDADTANFDPMFTEEAPVDSYVDSKLGTTAKQANKFDGFTYVDPSVMNQ